MMTFNKFIAAMLAFCAACLCGCHLATPKASPQLKIIAFYTGKSDRAHISFVAEANRWFSQMAAQHHFTYEATANWNELNAETLARHQVVLFLDTRPESPAQRAAFEQYMEHGGAWMGFHFAAFALTPSAVPQN